MREALEEHATQQNRRAREKSQREDRQLTAGTAVMVKATRVEKVVLNGDSATNSDVVSNCSDGVSQKRKKYRSGNYGERFDKEIDRCSAVLNVEYAAQRRPAR